MEKDQSRTYPTTEAKFYERIDLGSIKDDSINLVTNIWDTPGDEKFPTEILEDADVIIMVYSTLKEESFENLRRHKILIKKNCKKTPIVIVVRNTIIKRDER